MTQVDPAYIDRCFQGLELYGDNFSAAQIAAWNAQEATGYETIIQAADPDAGPRREYPYHALNLVNGYKKLPAAWRGSRVLLLGGAFGDEILPIIDRCEELHILEPSTHLRSKRLGHLAPIYRTPNPLGDLSYEADAFDLVTSFGVLHHIPNVSFVLKELHRVLKPGGYILIREPIVSMGDWRQPRGKLTANERGIPAAILDEAIRDAGLVLVSSRLCGFPPLRRMPFNIYASRLGVYLDLALARSFRFNYSYHATSRMQRVRPTSIFHVGQKPPRKTGELSP